MRRSHGGVDVYHGDAAHVDCYEHDGVPVLILCGCDLQVMLAPALEDWESPSFERDHVAFARQLAEGAYRYLELLVARQMESPTAA